MKLRNSNEQGGILLVVLMTSLILGITLASYLQYTSTQSRSIMRSQAWNAAIPVSLFR
jgi:Na+-transporting NADH:ubiquinone oxidoreductase subunit NqrC